MTPSTADYKDHTRGDTIGARVFTITKTVDGVTSAVDLTGAEIRVDFVLSEYKVSKRAENGITVNDAVNGEFQIDSFTLDHVGIWKYDIEIKFPDETVKTWIKGSIKILSDVTV